MPKWEIETEEHGTQIVEAASAAEAEALVKGGGAGGGGGGSWLPTIGETVGSIGGGIAGGAMGGPLGAVGGAGAGGMVGRTAGSVLAGEGVPSAGSLAVTGASNAVGEGLGTAALKTASRLGGITKFQEGASSILSRLRGNQTGTAPEFVGRALRDDIKGPMRAKINAESTKRYQDVVSTANRLKIAVQNPTKVADVATEFLARIGDPKDAADPATAKQVVDVLKTVGTWSTQHPSFEEYYNGYRALQQHFDDFAKLGMPSDLDEAVQSRLIGAMKADIDRAIKGTPVEAKLAEANRYFDVEKAPFRELIFKPATRTLQEEPSRLIGYLTEPGHPERFAVWWRNAGNDSRTALREAWLRQTLEGSFDAATKSFTAGDVWAQWYRTDPATRKLLFQGAEKEYKKIFDHLAHAQLSEKVAGQTGGMVRGFGPGGLTAHAGYALMRGNISEAIVSAAGAGGLSTILSSPKVMRLLSRGIEMEPGTKEAIRTGQKIVSGLVSAGLIDPMAQSAAGYSQPLPDYPTMQP